MRTTIRSFTPLFLLLTLLVLGTSACDNYPDSSSGQNSVYDLLGPDEDEPDVDDPDADGRPDDSDDPVESDPCEGVDRDLDWDCDGIPNSRDVLTIGPDGDEADEVGFHVSTVWWTEAASQISAVGYGFGGEEDWEFLGINPSRVGSWWVVSLADGDYRMTLRGAANGQWADYDAYCRDGVENIDEEIVRDPACCWNPNDNSYAVGVHVELGLAIPGDCGDILEMIAESGGQ